MGKPTGFLEYGAKPRKSSSSTSAKSTGEFELALPVVSICRSKVHVVWTVERPSLYVRLSVWQSDPNVERPLCTTMIGARH